MLFWNSTDIRQLTVLSVFVDNSLTVFLRLTTEANTSVCIDSSCSTKYLWKDWNKVKIKLEQEKISPVSLEIIWPKTCGLLSSTYKGQINRINLTL